MQSLVSSFLWRVRDTCQINDTSAKSLPLKAEFAPAERLVCYHALRTGCSPYIKYYCTLLDSADLLRPRGRQEHLAEGELERCADDRFFLCLKLLNLGTRLPLLLSPLCTIHSALCTRQSSSVLFCAPLCRRCPTPQSTRSAALHSHTWAACDCCTIFISVSCAPTGVPTAAFGIGAWLIIRHSDWLRVPPVCAGPERPVALLIPIYFLIPETWVIWFMSWFWPEASEGILYFACSFLLASHFIYSLHSSIGSSGSLSLSRTHI